MKKNKKGFSLIELLAVVVILGILAIITVVSYNRYIKSANHQSEVQVEKNVIMATKSFLQANKEYAPKNVGDSQRIDLKLLTDGNYVKASDFGSDDVINNSYIIVKKVSSNKYEYEPYIENLSSSPSPADSIPKIEINPIIPNKISNIEVNNGIDDVAFNIEMNACDGSCDKGPYKIASYSYTISVCNLDRTDKSNSKELIDLWSNCNNYKEVYSSGSLPGKNQSSMEIKNIKLKNYSKIEKFNKYKITATVTNNEGKKVQAKEAVFGSIDKTGPKCGNYSYVNDNGEPISASEISSGKKERIISVECIDDGGSKCRKKSFEYTWNKDTYYDNKSKRIIDTIPIEDNAGNVTLCPVNPNIKVIDNTDPVIKLYADNGNNKYGFKNYSKDRPMIFSGHRTVSPSDFITQIEEGNWLNRNYYGDGIYFYVDVSDNNGLSSIIWSANGKNKTISAGKRNRMIKSFLFKEDGKSTINLTAIDESGNISQITININMDLNVSVPVAEIRIDSKDGDIVSVGPNPQDKNKTYENKLWFGNFNFSDSVSGLKSYSLRYCGSSSLPPYALAYITNPTTKGIIFDPSVGELLDNCYRIMQVDNAGNASVWSDKYYLNVYRDLKGPDIKIYADDGYNNHGFKQYSKNNPLIISGRKKQIYEYRIGYDMYDTQSNANNWLNKAWYPSGVIHYVEVTDESPIKSVVWSTNNSNLNENDSNLKSLNKHYTYIPSGNTDLFSDENRKFNYGLLLNEDGVRYGVLTVTDIYNNITRVSINAKLDKTIETPKAEIRKNDKDGELVSDGPNPQDNNYNDTDLWWGNFTGIDALSGSRLIYKKCDPDNTEFDIDSKYIGSGKGYSIATDFDKTMRKSCYNIKQIDNAGNESDWSSDYNLNIQKDDKGPDITIYADNGNGEHGLKGYSKNNPIVLSGDSDNYKINYNQYDTQKNDWLNNEYYPNGIRYYVNVEDNSEIKQVYWGYNSPGKNNISDSENLTNENYYNPNNSDKFSNNNKKFTNTFSIGENDPDFQQDGVRYMVLTAEDVTGRTTTVEFEIKLDRKAISPQAEIRQRNSSGNVISIGSNKQTQNVVYNTNLWWGNFIGTEDLSGHVGYEFINCDNNMIYDIDESKYVGQNKGYDISPSSGDSRTSCYKLREYDNAGNYSNWSDPYYFKIQLDKKSPDIKIYADNGNGEHGFKNYSSNNPLIVNGQTGSDKIFSITDDQYDTQKNNWLNNSYYPNGVYYYVEINDDSEISEVKWETNETGLNENNQNLKSPGITYTYDNDASLFSNNKKTFNKTMSFSDIDGNNIDGVRYAKITAIDENGNKSILNFKVNIDRSTTPPVANIREVNKDGTILSNGPNPQYSNSYYNSNLWWGDFTGKDGLSGYNKFKFKKCDPDNTEFDVDDSKYVGTGKGYDIAPSTGSDKRMSCYNLKQFDNAGNESDWSDPYYLNIFLDDIVGPAVNISADNCNGRYGFSKISISGQKDGSSSYVIPVSKYTTQTIDDPYNDIANAHDWLNKAWYPDGVCYNVDISDSSGIKKVTWSTNPSGRKGWESDFKSMTSASYTPSSHSNRYLNNNKKFDYTWGVAADGVRYATIEAEDINGHKTTVEINAKIDRTTPAFPTANIRRYNASGEVLVSKPNPTNTHNYITNMWWGDFKGTDAMSGSRQYEYAVANSSDCSNPEYTGVTNSAGYTKPNSGNSHHSCYMLRQLDNAGNYSERSVNNKTVRWSEGYRMDIEKPSLNKDGNFTKWKVVYSSQSRSSCDTWSARPRILGSCPTGVYGNIVGIVDATYSNGNVTFDWYIAQSYGDGSRYGDESGTWIAKGFYVELVIVPYSSDPNNFTQNDVDYCGNYSDSKVTKCRYLKHYDDAIWDIGSSHGPGEHDGEEAITVSLPKGDYDVYFAGNSTSPSFTKWMGWIEIR